MPTCSRASGAPPIMLGGVDVTTQLQGGQIGANITLRDTTLPTDQAELDEFAQNLASRFDAQGLTLFTDPNGRRPAQRAGRRWHRCRSSGWRTPSLVRDGSHVVTGRPTGRLRSRRPASGPAGFNTAVIERVLTSAPVGAQVKRRATLHAPYARPRRWTGCSTMVAAQAQDSADHHQPARHRAGGADHADHKLSAQSGVNMDTEMSLMIQLQNAYGANAKVIAAVQAMWTQLLSTVQ